MKRFDGTQDYVATDDLKVAVNAAVALRAAAAGQGRAGHRQDGAGARDRQALDAPLIEWHVKSTTKAQQGLYEYDAVARLRDGQLGDPRVNDVSNYIRVASCGTPSTRPERPVLLIDEIDKADIEFPNDLLQELDRMEFYVYETGETVARGRRPVVVITSQQRKGTAGRVPAPLFLPLHPLPGSRDDAGDRGRPLSGHPADAGLRGAATSSTRCATCRASRRNRRPASCSTG